MDFLVFLEELCFILNENISTVSRKNKIWNITIYKI